MKQTLSFIIFVGIFLSSLSIADERLPEYPEYKEDCQRYVGSCEYYLCREKNNPCGGDGYFIDFGYKYCTKLISRLLPKVSTEAKEWLIETAGCLQEQLDSVPDSSNCSEIKKTAIKGHAFCYEEAGFCSLKISDKMKLLKMISPSLRERGVLKQGYQVARHCLNTN